MIPAPGGAEQHTVPPAVASRSGQPSPEALAHLFALWYPDLARLAFLLTSDRALAEDLAQETFIRAWTHWGRVRDEQLRLAYLRTTLVNLVRSNHRRRLLSVRHPIADEQPAGPDLDAQLDVARAVAQLPLRRRACVVLRYYADLSEADVAAVLGVSVGTVKSQTARALASLRDVLADVEARPADGGPPASATR